MDDMKRFVRIIAYILGTIAISLTVLQLCNTDEFSTTNYSYQSSKVTAAMNGYKIVQVSDVHNHGVHYRNTDLLSAIDVANPNLVVCTGDLIDSHTKSYENLIALFEHCQQKSYPVYYVSGNHEGYEKKGRTLTLMNYMNQYGVISAETTRYEPIAGLTISGLRDPAFVESDHGYLYPCEGDVKAQLTTLDNGFDSSKLNILLSHRPELYSLYKNHGYDLVYSGHTHGNQMGFTWTPFTVNQFFPKHFVGYYQEKPTSMIVSRGLGYSYSMPFRVLCNAEITVTTFLKA
jgi:predicted MPP superfamily phosphohydrolase